MELYLYFFMALYHILECNFIDNDGMRDNVFYTINYVKQMNESKFEYFLEIIVKLPVNKP